MIPRLGRRTKLPWLLQLMALSLCSWAISAAVTGDYLLIVRLGIYAAPLLMVLALGLAVLSVFYRAVTTAIAMGAVTAGLFALHAPPLVRAMTPHDAQTLKADSIEVISLSNRSLNLDLGPTARLVRAEDVDLFILQEVADPEALIDAVDQLGGRQLYSCHRRGFVVFSKHPLNPPFEGIWTGMMACKAYLPSGPTWVGSVHLPRGVASKEPQDRVVEHLLAVFEDMPGPKIIAGDFNATPLSSPIRRMESRLQNAFAEAGTGFGFTFPTPARKFGFAGPFLQIDYVFHSRDFKTLSAEVMRNHPPLADHFPVKAVLRLANDP